MSWGSVLCVFLAACSTGGARLDLPPGYRMVYSQDFATQGGRNELHFSDPEAWDWYMDAAAARTWLEVHEGSDYDPPQRSPRAIALVRDLEVRDFVLELDLASTAPEDRGAHRDLCIFFGWQDPSHFYYVHLAPGPDERAHNIFLVDGADRRPLAEVAAEGIDWGEGWHHVRVERELTQGSIRVFFDGGREPILKAWDRSLDWGRIGFGTFDDSGRFTDLHIFAPEARLAHHADPFR